MIWVAAVLLFFVGVANAETLENRFAPHNIYGDKNGDFDSSKAEAAKNNFFKDPQLMAMKEELLMNKEEILAAVTGDCLKDSLRLFNDILSINENSTVADSYPLLLLDSYARPEAGIIFGNRKWYGSFEECTYVSYVSFSWA